MQPPPLTDALSILAPGLKSSAISAPILGETPTAAAVQINLSAVAAVAFQPPIGPELPATFVAIGDLPYGNKLDCPILGTCRVALAHQMTQHNHAAGAISAQRTSKAAACASAASRTTVSVRSSFCAPSPMNRLIVSMTPSARSDAGWPE
jgi:hypothetical protein